MHPAVQPAWWPPWPIAGGAPCAALTHPPARRSPAPPVWGNPVGLPTRRPPPPAARRPIRTPTTAGLSVGGKRIDNGDSYENMLTMGKAMKASGVARKDIFLVTKVGDGGLGLGEEDCNRQVKYALGKYQTDYLDLLLIHWPTSGMNSSDPHCQEHGAKCVPTDPYPRHTPASLPHAARAWWWAAAPGRATAAASRGICHAARGWAVDHRPLGERGVHKKAAPVVCVCMCVHV